MAQSIKAVAIGRQVSLVGVLAGVQCGFDLMSMFLSQATFPSIATGSRRVLSQHKIRPVIDSAYCFVEAKAALTHYAAQNLLGNVVIRH